MADCSTTPGRSLVLSEEIVIVVGGEIVLSTGFAAERLPVTDLLQVVQPAGNATIPIRVKSVAVDAGASIDTGVHLGAGQDRIAVCIHDAGSRRGVRRSRRRFWKSEDDSDKNNAYKTLHYVLLKLSVILAPFTPFLAEELYHNMGGEGESVHLLDWPTNYTVDQQTLDDMARTRELINTGLGLRMQKDEHQDSIKVRQPLATVSYGGDKLGDYYEQIISDELNVKSIKNISSEPDGSWVEIDKKITPELKREGLMREVIRLVQSARKQAGLNVDDRIVLSLTTTDQELQRAIDEWQDAIRAETLSEYALDFKTSSQTTAKIDNTEIEIKLKKVS